MADKKNQHIIPRCYLKAWCDPSTPIGHAPYIWRISRDGSKKLKKSPEKSFTETDKYTIHLPDGGRNLILEDTLGHIEHNFVDTLKRVRQQKPLSKEDNINLCTFAAAMHTRSSAMGKHWKNHMKEVHEQVVNLEKEIGAEPHTSLETARAVEHAHHQLIASGISTQVPLLYQMALTIFVTAGSPGFITSDTPCVWFNPEWYKLPPFYRSPGLIQPQIEVSLPLSPQYMMVIHYRRDIPNYIEASPIALREYNRRTRFHCDLEFVSCTSETKSEWFDEGVEPPDSWEKTHGKS